MALPALRPTIHVSPGLRQGLVAKDFPYGGWVFYGCAPQTGKGHAVEKISLQGGL